MMESFIRSRNFVDELNVEINFEISIASLANERHKCEMTDKNAEKKLASI